MIVAKSAPPTATVELEASLVWLSERPHEPTRKLLMKHTSRWVPARVASLVGKLSLTTLDVQPASAIELNDIVRVRLSTARPIFCDPDLEGRDTGAFILVDAIDNSTVAAGMVEAPRESGRIERDGPVDLSERAERLGHRSALVRVASDGVRLERLLFHSEINALSVGHTHPEVVSSLVRAGTVVIVEAVSDESFLVLSRVVAPAIALDLRASSGDLARHVAKVARLRYPASAVPAELRSTILQMGHVAERIVEKAGSVIAARDLEAAQQIERDDDAMDDLHRELFARVTDPSWRHGTEAAIDITLVGRYYERFADHAVSVGHRVIWLVTGEFDPASEGSHEDAEDGATVGA